MGSQVPYHGGASTGPHVDADNDQLPAQEWAEHTEALRKLYAEGGVAASTGMWAALFQAPFSRLATAANAGMLALLERTKPSQPTSRCSRRWRPPYFAFLMPIDAFKTILQVEGAQGMAVLRDRIARGGVITLYDLHSLSFATLMGHYPWFFTYNFLQARVPKPPPDSAVAKNVRNALIGFFDDFDVVSNSIRVIKTAKQTSNVPVGYIGVASQIIAAEGIQGICAASAPRLEQRAAGEKGCPLPNPPCARVFRPARSSIPLPPGAPPPIPSSYVHPLPPPHPPLQNPHPHHHHHHRRRRRPISTHPRDPPSHPCGTLVGNVGHHLLALL